MTPVTAVRPLLRLDAHPLTAPAAWAALAAYGAADLTTDLAPPAPYADLPAWCDLALAR